MHRLDFAGLIASRLCHDLSSPVGAIAAGVELLADETDSVTRREIEAIVASSAASLSVRLRFYRLLFGAGPDGPLPGSEALGLLSAYLACNAAVTVELAASELASTRSLARVLLALAVTAADALERGGDVGIERADAGWRIRARGPVLRLAAEQRVALQGGEPDNARPRVAAALLAAALAEVLGVTITIVEAPDRLAFAIDLSSGSA